MSHARVCVRPLAAKTHFALIEATSRRSWGASVERTVNWGMVEYTVLDRATIVRRGRRLEYFTIAWNAVEGLVAILAGLVAGSISLVGFGIDSFIEVTSGSVLLWRMW